MEKNIDFLGVIPARGGSKGIPKKNIKPIAGTPLIAWTIEQAKKSELLNTFFVSTDSNEIADIAKLYGSRVLSRPPELATDDSLIINTLQHILLYYPAKNIVLLQPTSPIRSPNLIDNCIKKYRKNIKADTLVTGFDCHYKPYSTYYKRRQDIEPFFYNDGNIYILNSNLIKKGKINSKNYIKYYTSRRENVEIDDDFDFWLAEKILEEKHESI